MVDRKDLDYQTMRSAGFGDIQVVQDLNRIPRVVFGTLCREV